MPATAAAEKEKPATRFAKDRDQDTLNTITLSYTFYRMPEKTAPVAEAPDKNSNRL